MREAFYKKYQLIARMPVIALGSLVLLGCPLNSEDAMMWRLYKRWHPSIQAAVDGTDISAPYMAAVISLESHPPGNPNSKRFEPNIYRKLQALRDQGTPFGYMKRSALQGKTDTELREMATSHGLVQIMGYHCLHLKCEVSELSGRDQLLWAVAFMQGSYAKAARRHDWESCFRIHNTGRHDGKTSRGDYVKRGLIRMRYYQKWMDRNGRLF